MKKILVFVLAAIFVCGTLLISGCEDPNALRVATNAEFYPFEFVEKGCSDKYKGIDMELAQAIAEKLGRKLKIIDMDFSAVTTSVAQGQADLGIAALTINEDRLLTLDFSDPYFEASQYLIVKIDDNRFADCEDADDVIATLQDLGNNVKVGFQSGTTGDFFMSESDDEGNKTFPQAQLSAFDNGGLAVNKLIDGTINMVIIDEMPARHLVEQNSDKIKVVEIPLTEEQYAIAVKKGNTELLDLINEALAAIREEGKLDEIMSKYFS